VPHSTGGERQLNIWFQLVKVFPSGGFTAKYVTELLNLQSKFELMIKQLSFCKGNLLYGTKESRQPETHYQ
jgi:hypothetical protein